MTDISAPRPLRIATRASRLALWQAEHVANLLSSCRPDCGVELVHVTTTGDSNQTSELRSFGGQGVFTREVQRAVLDGLAKGRLDTFNRFIGLAFRVYDRKFSAADRPGSGGSPLHRKPSHSTVPVGRGFGRPRALAAVPRA